MASTTGVLYFLSILWTLGKAMTDPCLLPNHTYTTNNNTICHCCAPGFFKIDDCSQSGQQARCQACRKGYYSSTYNQAKYCQPCSSEGICLRQNQIITQNCSATSNRICECISGFYFKARPGSRGDGDCFSHSQCEAGYELEVPGTILNDTKCRECVIGTFSNTSSFDANACHNCSRCVPPDVVIQKCSKIMDTICGRKEDSILSKPQSEDGGDNWILLVTVVSVAACLLIGICIIVYCLRKHNMESFQFVQKVNFFQHCFPVESGDTEQGSVEKETNEACVPLHHTERSDPITTEQLAGACPYNTDQKDQYRTESACYDAEDGKTFAEIEREWINMFIWLSKEMPVDIWKAVIRSLFAVSKSEDKADNVIDEVIEDNQNKVREQIYQCLTQWRQKRSTEEWKLIYIIEALDDNEQLKLKNDLKSKWPSLAGSNDKYTERE